MIDTFYFCALIKHWCQCYAINVINIRRRISYVVHFNSRFALWYFVVFVLCFYFVYFMADCLIYHLVEIALEGNVSRHVVCVCVPVHGFSFQLHKLSCHVTINTIVAYHILSFALLLIPSFNFIINQDTLRKQRNGTKKKLHTQPETSERESRNCATVRFHSANTENANKNRRIN